jgi:hypothetical protein
MRPAISAKAKRAAVRRLESAYDLLARDAEEAEVESLLEAQVETLLDA